MYVIIDVHLYIDNMSGVDSSGEEEEEETGGSNEGGVAALTEQFHYLTLHRPVCQPDRPSKARDIY